MEVQVEYKKNECVVVKVDTTNESERTYVIKPGEKLIVSSYVCETIGSVAHEPDRS